MTTGDKAHGLVGPVDYDEKRGEKCVDEEDPKPGPAVSIEETTRNMQKTIHN